MARRKTQSPQLPPPTPRGSSAPQEIKETTESIVIAFILAFVFRAFIVEAFVIPTGSMAATLYGQHGTLICQDCGWENVYGLSDPSGRGNVHGPGAKVRCQNCDHLNTPLKIHDGSGRAAGGRRDRGNSESGDRILVFKWPTDIARDLLGHSDLRAVDRHYNQASQVQAGRAYHQALLVERHDLAQIGRKRGQRR